MDQRAQGTSTHTFIGPVAVDMRAGKLISAYFYVLQKGSGMLKLDYPDKASATSARTQLLKSNHTHKVGSNTLLQAIQEALSEGMPEQPQDT